jgi:hypothetical protein
MGRGRHTAEQIIGKLWAAEIDPGNGMSTVREVGELGRANIHLGRMFVPYVGPT